MVQLTERISEYFKSIGIYGTTMNYSDVLEIFIIAFLLYYILDWMQKTRAWLLLKGLLVVGAFLIIAYTFNMTTIMWLARNVIGIAVTAIVIVMQPELRYALEELGKRNFLSFGDGRAQSDFSMRTIEEIVKACVAMGKARTGALIVIEQKESVREYEQTGIVVDAVVTSQLLINIFEHNTPLHDGAVVVRGGRVAAATCYLPLSDNLTLSKELGTRHRAGVGVSEVTDSITVIVSEETGKISVAKEGKLERNLDADTLRSRLMQALPGREDEEAKGPKQIKNIWRSKKHERKNAEN